IDSNRSLRCVRDSLGADSPGASRGRATTRRGRRSTRSTLRWMRAQHKRRRLCVMKIVDADTPTRRDWLALATLATGLGVIVLDGTIVGIALPRIITDLDLTLTDAQWVNSLYAVVLAALLLATGKLADRWGRRKLFIGGLAVFTVGSVLAAVAQDAGGLISARAVQALGASGILPATLSTVNATFRGKYRAAAFGVWGAVISGAAAIGPLAGGALTEYATWRWIFLVNV